MRINGQEYALTKVMSLQELLQEQGYRSNLVAVELNGAIVKRSEYGSTMLTAEDKLEIVSFVGGG